MLPTTYRITRVQETLRRFENDIPLLNMRVKDLSAERQRSARQFAAALISQTRSELDRLLEEQPECMAETGEAPCEPAD
jgi:primosomal protein N''